MAEFEARPLAGKTVVLGVTGSIAAFKVPHIASRMTAMGARVVVVMTENATRFVAPLTFETLTGIEVVVSMFPEKGRKSVASAEEALERDDHLRHVHLAEAADLAIVAPATANVIGKMAGGIADDFLSTELLAMTCPVLLAPAMNVHMMESPAVAKNLETLRSRGVIIVEAEAGRLASGAVGKGRLADPDRIADMAVDILLPEQDLADRRVVVTAGPTRESIDPVRHISNPSSGRMGFALAERAARRGAQVTLISGPVSLGPPDGVKYVTVTTTDEMYEAVSSEMASLDMLFMAAAPADYRPKVRSEEKLRKGPEPMVLELEPTVDILSSVAGKRRPGQCLVGFALETENEERNARAKLERKGLDLIVVNNPKMEGAAFGTETNVATLIGRSGGVVSPGMISKTELADIVLTAALEEMGEKKSER
ncbi:MAG: bifunctional phosphopantothenoylcysteine decarboxylase/phosphopantothenate--cysteine ligase CoaBC [Candidatus Eisenbacteria bacterium]|nr:bifunctional phosphopantothenoylcysteine decarboxylase/phosphopantothenate--cysteine ligase CoaBC [Candidatus Eisenbacteria bacterium]